MYAALSDSGRDRGSRTVICGVCRLKLKDRQMMMDLFAVLLRGFDRRIYIAPVSELFRHVGFKIYANVLGHI